MSASHTLFKFPPEIWIDHIFPYLKLKGKGGLLSVSEVCRLYYSYYNDGANLAPQIKRNFGEIADGKNTILKYMLLYFFKLGISVCYVEGNRALHERASHYFAQMHALINALGTLPEQQEPWISHIKAVIHLGGFGLNPASEVEKNTQIAQGLSYLEAAAKAKYPPAQTLLAILHLRDIQLPLSELFLTSDIKPKSAALFNLASLLHKNIEGRITLSLEVAMQALNDAYASGHDEATAIFALLHWFGAQQLQIEQNKEEARRILSTASSEQKPLCRFTRAMFSFRNLLLLRDDPEISSIQFAQEKEIVLAEFEEMALSGSVEAARFLGCFYMSAPNIDDTESIKWSQHAAALGDQRVACALGNLYLSGEQQLYYDIELHPEFQSTEQDIHAAIKYFTLGLNDSELRNDDFMLNSYINVVECLLKLISIYSSGKNGIKTDLEKVLKLCQQGEKIGSPDVLLHAGFLFLFGDTMLGVIPDEQKAESFLRKALTCLWDCSKSAKPIIEKIQKFCWNSQPSEKPSVLKHLIKWCMRGAFVQDSSGYDCLYRMLMRCNHADYGIVVRDEVAYAELNKRFDDKHVLNLPILSQLYHRAFGLPYTPDEFLLLNPQTVEPIENPGPRPV